MEKEFRALTTWRKFPLQPFTRQPPLALRTPPLKQKLTQAARVISTSSNDLNGKESGTCCYALTEINRD